jgi:hypothetical protein
VNPERRLAPIDASVLGAAAPEVLSRLDRLRAARRVSRQQARERAREHDFRGGGHLAEHLARIVILENRHRQLIDDVARIGAIDHVVKRGAGLELAVQDRPIDGRPSPVLGQQRAVHVQGPARSAIEHLGAEERAVVEGENEIGPQVGEPPQELRALGIAGFRHGQTVLARGVGDAREPTMLLRIILDRDDQRHLDLRRQQHLQAAHTDVVVAKHHRARAAHGSVVPRARSARSISV